MNYNLDAEEHLQRFYVIGDADRHMTKECVPRNLTDPFLYLDDQEFLKRFLFHEGNSPSTNRDFTTATSTKTVSCVHYALGLNWSDEVLFSSQGQEHST